MLPSFIETCRRDEDGAVTVDWVVLTAGLIVFGAMAGGYILAGSTSMSESVGERLSEAEVPQIDFNAAP